MNVIVDGLMTNYQKLGSGTKTVVLLHGWGVDLDNLKPLADELAGKYSVYLVDLPGFGGTESAPDPWKLDEYSKFVKDWLKKIGVKEVYAMVGHSNGGAIAIKAVSDGQISPNRLVLLASSGVRNKKKVKRFVYKTLSKTGKVITTPLPASTRRKIRRRFYSKLGSDIGLFPQMEDTFRNIIKQDIQADARKIKIPTLLIYGTEDRETPLSYGQLLHLAIEGSRLETIQGAGHFIHQQNPHEVNKLITEFLEAK